MKKNEVKISENGVKYYVNENGVKVVLWEGEKYTFYPFVDCDPEMQNEVIAYLKETQPNLFKNQFFFYNVFLPNYQVRLRVVSDGKDEYMDMDDSQNLPIMIETKKWWVSGCIMSFCDNIGTEKIVTEKERLMNYDEFHSKLKKWIDDYGLLDDYKDILAQDDKFVANVICDYLAR